MDGGKAVSILEMVLENWGTYPSASASASASAPPVFVPGPVACVGWTGSFSIRTYSYLLNLHSTYVNYQEALLFEIHV